jgi:catechol 2,3-dioxygenase-like lactoylglutathione lyase family enzyme
VGPNTFVQWFAAAIFVVIGNQLDEPRGRNLPMTDPNSLQIDMVLEVVVIPVADVDRAKRFYGGLGWRIDADIVTTGDFRLVQITPPGSTCSIQFGKGVTPATPGSEGCLYLVVSDIQAARQHLVDCGVDVSQVFHRSPAREEIVGRDPQGRSYASFISFSDSDGNAWLVQEVTTRLPGRVAAGATAFKSLAALTGALRRAAAAHGEHEKQTGQQDLDWPDWYAKYMLSEEAKGVP